MQEWEFKPAAVTGTTDISTEEIEHGGILLLSQEDSVPLVGEIRGLGSSLSVMRESSSILAGRPSVSDVVSLMDDLQLMNSSIQLSAVDVDAHTAENESQPSSMRRSESEVAILGEMEGLESTEPFLKSSPEKSSERSESTNLLCSREEPSMLSTSASVLPTLLSTSPQSLLPESANERWQMAWQVDHVPTAESTDTCVMRRVIILPSPEITDAASSLATTEQSVPSVVLISESTRNDLVPEGAVGPAMVHPSELARVPEPVFHLLLEGGVLKALTVGVGLQALQQVV